MNTLITTAILLILTSPCFSSTVEFDLTAGRPHVQISIERPITAKVSAISYTGQSQTWGQTRLGFSYAPVSNIKIGFSAGYETGGNRVGASIWVEKDRFSGFYVAESGASGTWDKMVVKYQATDRFAIGYTKKQFAGDGVYMDFRISKELTFKFSGFEKPELALQMSF